MKSYKDMAKELNASEDIVRDIARNRIKSRWSSFEGTLYLCDFTYHGKRVHSDDFRKYSAIRTIVARMREIDGLKDDELLS